MMPMLVTVNYLIGHWEEREGERVSCENNE